MDRYLLLQKNGHVSLLVAYPDRYHIIAVNNKLDEQKEERILAGNCSDAVIDEMGLSRETIMKANLRGVAIGGCRAGDVVVLYTKNKKWKYVLSDDCTDEDMDGFFAGIERFQAPKSAGPKSHKTDWRIQMQDKAAQKAMEIIGSVLNLGGCVCFVGTALFGRLSVVWPIVCLLTVAVSLGMYLAYPQYFSLMGSKEYKRAGYTAKVKHLEFAVAAPALMLWVRISRDFCFPNWWPLILAGVVMGIAVTVIMYIFSREVRENTAVIVIILLLAMFFSGSIIGEVNHLANFNADETQILTVADTRQVTGSKGSKQHYCVVTDESGQEIKIPINSSMYQQMQPGDKVTVFIGEGALGITYAYFIAPE